MAVNNRIPKHQIGARRALTEPISPFRAFYANISEALLRTFS